MTFCMTGSRETPCGGFVGRIVKELRFQDVCTTSGKWFHVSIEMFRPVGGDETFREKSL
jgi:hypothetical protein